MSIQVNYSTLDRAIKAPYATLLMAYNEGTAKLVEAFASLPNSSQKEVFEKISLSYEKAKDTGLGKPNLTNNLTLLHRELSQVKDDASTCRAYEKMQEAMAESIEQFPLGFQREVYNRYSLFTGSQDLTSHPTFLHDTVFALMADVSTANCMKQGTHEAKLADFSAIAQEQIEFAIATKNLQLKDAVAAAFEAMDLAAHKPVQTTSAKQAHRFSKAKNNPFPMMTIKISKGHRDKEPIQFASLKELRQKAREISQQVFEKHCQLRIGFSEGDLKRTEATKFIEQLRTRVDVRSTYWEEIFYATPKRAERVQGNLTIRHYDNGVVEEVHSVRNDTDWTDWKGRRIFSDGRLKEGDFDRFFWHRGTRTENKQTMYRRPTIYMPVANRGLMYGDEKKTQLIAVQEKPGTEDHAWCFDYIPTNENPLVVLADLLQKGPYNILDLTKMLSGPIDAEKFIQHCFTTNAIFSFSRETLEHLIEIAQRKDLQIDLKQRHPETKENLFDCYLAKAGSEVCSKKCREKIFSKRAEVLGYLIAIDPTVIQKAEGMQSSFVRALLTGNKQAASVVLAAMEEQEMELTASECLFHNVVFKQITLDELKTFSEEDLKIAHKLATIHQQWDVLRMMKGLGFVRKEALIMREGPSIFGCNMDLFERRDQAHSFLANLRLQGSLWTQSEFKQLFRENNYLSKDGDIGRIFGRDYLEKKINELGLKHIKVPKKLIVVDDETTDLELFLTYGLDIEDSRGVTVYATRIVQSGRQVALEEIDELLRLFEATGFTDIHWDNIIVAEEGIYIIDTKFTNFWLNAWYFKRGRQFAEMTKIIRALPDNEQRPLLRQLNKKTRTYRRNEKAIDEQRQKRTDYEAAAMQKSGSCYSATFTFPVSELLSPKMSIERPSTR